MTTENRSDWAAILRNRNVLTLTISWSLMLVAMYSWFPVLPIYLRQMGGDDSAIAWTYTALLIGYAVPQLLGGLLVDRLGKKTLLVYSTAGAGLAYLLLAFTRSPWVFLIGLFCVAFLTAFHRPALTILLAESVPMQVRGTAFGVFELGYTLAITIGPLLGALLIPFIGVRGLLIASIVMYLLMALLRALVLVDVSSPSPQALPVNSPEKQLSKVSGLFLLIVCFVFLIQNLTMQGPFVSLHASDVFKMTEGQINLLFAMGGVGAILASLLAGRLVDHFGGFKMLGISIVIHVVSMLTWGFWSGISNTLAFLAANITLEFVMVADNVLTINLAGKNKKGLFVGLIGTVGGVIAAFAPSMGMLARGTWGSLAPFWLALALSVVVCLLLLWVKRIQAN